MMQSLIFFFRVWSNFIYIQEESSIKATIMDQSIFYNLLKENQF